MLDREVVERLKKKLAVARGDTNPFGGPFQVDDARHEILKALPELLRVYRAWLDAPVMQVTDCNNPLRQLPSNPLDVTWEDFPTYNVRLVRDGDSGEG